MTETQNIEIDRLDAANPLHGRHDFAQRHPLPKFPQLERECLAQRILNGLDYDLALMVRVNEHFGRDIEKALLIGCHQQTLERIANTFHGFHQISVVVGVSSERTHPFHQQW